ncbi:MAG: LacI family DNA-binding transcriptional regulator [Anaerolineae bacterium]|nr:LacI family DNA-binding transcriptional regulator [Anaerolineae bacterium]MCB0176811.1 LacI family DNA-binding transcriptional regulator [Anaerolineae bacterium]MCB0224128.1 LacI family DNA-binding transcriptional regulator [Anaerolineae bacterium]MCB9109372.1 LacI family DNA-binding transcriptional regulator [Anaerolineales bacterium]
MARKKSAVTIFDVAAAAGVSVSTVSRVLNNKDDVAAETYDEVQRVIAELGYASSLAARSMRSRTTNAIGLIVAKLNDPFNIEVMKGVDRAIIDFGYDLLIYTSGHHATGSGTAWERDYVARLNGSLTDGIIIVTPTTANLPLAFPLVTVDPPVEDSSLPSVITTNREGALSVMEYLINLGHRRIGFIGGRSDLQSAIRRRQGYEDGLQRAGLPVIPELIQIGDYTRKTGYECAKQFLNLPDPPTAIFAANDESAFGVVEAASESGLRIPEDLSIVGFDNIPQTAHTNPPLTTVAQFIDQMGYVATKMLIELIQNKSLENRLHKIPTRLIVRDSCRAV